MKEFRGMAELLGGGLPDCGVTRGSTALMIIDMQYLDAHRDHGLGVRGRDNGRSEDMEYYFQRLENVVTPNIARLLGVCRRVGIPVVHVRIVTGSDDSSNKGWRYNAFGLDAPVNSKAAEILAELVPLTGEVILNKSTSSVFMSTNADEVLRRMRIDTLIMTGVLTDNCVEFSARNAADLGYRVLLVDDACATWTAAGHEHSLMHMNHNYAIVKGTAAILDELSAVVASNERESVT